jgi:hypothetical protein
MDHITATAALLNILVCYIRIKYFVSISILRDHKTFLDFLVELVWHPLEAGQQAAWPLVVFLVVVLVEKQLYSYPQGL